MFTIGIDEVGRGPLAGPVTAAAVALPDAFDAVRVADSKVLTAAQRTRIAAALRTADIPIAIAWVSAAEIDALNIHNASLLAMQRALEALIGHALNAAESPVPGATALAATFNAAFAAGTVPILVDGRFVPPIPYPCRAVVGGDGTIPAVGAASIVAKVARDAWMERYALTDPRYGFERHKGYPTAQHRAALRLHGPCPIHRRSFRGVASE